MARSVRVVDTRERSAMTGHHVRVLRTLILLVPLSGLVDVGGLATRGAWAQPVDSILGCALLHGQPSIDACDEAMRSRLPVEIRAEAAYKKGLELGELARYGDAVHAYRAAIRLKPDYVDAHRDLAVALGMLGQPDAALREFRKIAELTPRDADAHYNVGFALNSLGRHAEAMQAYREAVRLRPDYADAWGNLGLSAHLIGRDRESTDAFERAEALLPAYFDSRPRQREAFAASRGDGVGSRHRATKVQ